MELLQAEVDRMQTGGGDDDEDTDEDEDMGTSLSGMLATLAGFSLGSSDEDDVDGSFRVGCLFAVCCCVGVARVFRFPYRRWVWAVQYLSACVRVCGRVCAMVAC